MKRLSNLRSGLKYEVFYYGHNKSILRMDDPQKKTQNNGCNCKSPNKCPLPGKCLAKSIVYQATVTTNDNYPDQKPIGLTSNTFKTRFANHKTSFTNVKKKHATELSKHVWQLKDKYIDYKIKWEIIKQASPYNNTSNRCNLCMPLGKVFHHLPSISGYLEQMKRASIILQTC